MMVRFLCVLKKTYTRQPTITIGLNETESSMSLFLLSLRKVVNEYLYNMITFDLIKFNAFYKKSSEYTTRKGF